MRQTLESQLSYQTIESIEDALAFGNSIVQESEVLRQEEIHGERKRKLTDALKKEAIYLLTVADEVHLPDFKQARILAELARNTGDPDLEEIALEKLDDAFPSRTGSPIADWTNELTKQEYEGAIEDTDLNRNFTEALLRQEEKSEGNIEILAEIQDVAKQERLLHAPAAELPTEDDAVAYDPFKDEKTAA